MLKVAAKAVFANSLLRVSKVAKAVFDLSQIYLYRESTFDAYQSYSKDAVKCYFDKVTFNSPVK